MNHRKPLHNIAVTVAYGDVFDYPLTQEELALWAIGNVGHIVSPSGVVEKNALFFLSGKERIIALRRNRAEIAQKKWKRIAALAWVFRLVPTVTLVGVTGGLAMNNAKKDDDIDLFFITRSGTLWITRMMVTLLSEILCLRRRPHDREVQDKVCLNMFVSEQSLSLHPSERDLFSAHEVLQMVPLWERGGAYSKFLKANQWVKAYLPNAWKEKSKIENLKSKMYETPLNTLVFHFSFFVLRLFEPLAQTVQLWYMKSKRTNEVIRSGMIRFHPRDARVWVREKFAKRLQRWNIPLDKIFYRR